LGVLKWLRGTPISEETFGDRVAALLAGGRYRWLTFMMLDADVEALSPASVVLRTSVKKVRDPAESVRAKISSTARPVSRFTYFTQT